jgi:hypothetical protein
MKKVLITSIILSMMGVAIANERPDRSEIVSKAYALFELVYSCAKSNASKEACRAQLSTALRQYY